MNAPSETPGCSVCNPQGHPAASFDEIRAAIEKDIQIAGDGNNGWAVISLNGDFRFHDSCPCVIYSGLSTREAAEVARRDAIGNLTETHHRPYGPSAVPIHYFESIGRIVRKLREAGVRVEDDIALAMEIADTATAGDWNDPDDPSLPF